MPDDFSMPQLGNAAGPGGIPLGYGSPQQIQQYYLQMMRDKQKQQAAQPIRSWTQVAGNVLDTLADQMQMNKLMGGAQKAREDTASTVPGLPPIAGTQDVSQGPAPQAAPAGNAAQPGGNAASVQPYEGDGTDAALTNFIKQKEGFRANAYADGRQTSIGWGTRAQPGEKTITPEAAEQRLHDEVGKAAASVHAFKGDIPAPIGHALTDLTYNAGTKWMGSGLGEAVKAGDWAKAKELFTQYSHADGQFNKGLYNRRLAMAPMFDQGGGGVSSASMPMSQAHDAMGLQPVPGKGSYTPIPGNMTQPMGSAPPTSAPAGQTTPPGGSPTPAPEGAGAPTPQKFLPPAPGAREAYQRDYDAAQKKIRSFDPEVHSQGIKDIESLQKRLEKSQYVDPNTGHVYFGNDIEGRTLSSMPRQPTKPELAGQEAGAKKKAEADVELSTAGAIKGSQETQAELAKAKVVPVAEAIKSGAAAQKSLAALNVLDSIGSMPGSENMNTGPFAQHWLHVKQALGDITGLPIEGVAPAEGINKMNAFLGMQAAKELTNRPTQFDFKTFLANNPGIEMSPDGRKMLTDILKQTTQQDIKLSNMATKIKDPEQWADIRDAFYADPKNQIVVHYKGKAITSDASLSGASDVGGTGGGTGGTPGAPPAAPAGNAPAPTPFSFFDTSDKAKQAALATNKSASEGAISRGDIVTPGAGVAGTWPVTGPLALQAVRTPGHVVNKLLGTTGEHEKFIGPLLTGGGYSGSLYEIVRRLLAGDGK